MEAAADPIWGGLATLMYARGDLPRPWASRSLTEEVEMDAALQDAPTNVEPLEARDEFAGSGVPESAEEPVSEPEDAAEGQLYLEANGQLTLSVGGKTPTSSSLRLVGGSIELGGSYAKGDTIQLECLLRVDEVAFVDRHDTDTGRVVSTERRHKARVVEIRGVS